MVIGESPVGLGCEINTHPRTADDRRDHEPARARREDPRRRPVAGDDRLCGRAPDGDGGRRPDRSRLWREELRASGAAQRLPGARLGDPRRHGRAAHPEAAQGLVLPRLPGAATARREGAHRRRAGGLHPGHLDPLRRRPRQGARHEWHLEEPGEPALRGDRRAREGRSSTARSRATGPTCGSTPPT